MTSQESDGGLRDQLQASLSGSYRVVRELGGGGMARVFLAEEHNLGRRVVVKVLSPDVAHALSAERFAREIKLSARLQHPNIVPVLTAGAVDALPYYTMPFIEGDSLRARLSSLDAGKRLPRHEAIGVLRDVARALAYAHGAGVVHRDIKPENVLLAFEAAVVADFGVAKAVVAARTSDSSTSATLTQGGVSLGTPAYMAPEQAAGDPNVDHRADLYAWGVMAYELLAGKHPFAHHRSVQSLIAAQLTEQPRPLSEAAPDVSDALSALVMRCLAKDAAQRPASARELTEVVSDSSPANVDGWTGQQRRVRLVTATMIVALVASVPGAIYLNKHFPDDTTTVARKAVSSPASSNSVANDAYLRGKVRVARENREDNDAAIAALRQAVAADPSFAPAFAELSRAYSIKAFYFATDSEKTRLIEDAEVAVAKAMGLDANLGAAHFAQGFMLWTPGRRFPHEQAVQAYHKAIALDPGLDEAHHQLGLIFIHVGLLDEGRAEFEKALAINPANTGAAFRLGVAALYGNDFAKAYEIFKGTPPQRNPSLLAFQMATALFRLGREAEATTLLDKFLHDYPKDEGGVGTSVRAMMLAKAGKRREAQAAIARSLRLGEGFGHFHHTAYNLASAYALLGDQDNAIRFLQTAADDGFPCYPLFNSDAQLDGLRKNPRFVALMAGLERTWRERKSSFTKAAF